MAEKKTGIDQALIRDLANILNETDLTEIEVEQEDLRIRVSRAGTTQYVQAPIAAPAYAAAAPAAAPAAAAPAGKVRNPDSVISAPMVGTVYLASAPGAAAFIQVGSVVKEGQTLLIIEAMKTMNQIPAPKSGTVTEILIKDGSPVEYGEALVVIE
ncbi:acetyl-CoA carboxylase biotin carboxyl carrier protein [Agrobacterium sp. SHOUNA12C]|uniref:Biotin carboxyl carrier protein of acetyl-CoA carboxylase n=2 Tax=Rhizobium rhizogenes TaxID=359 RepID=B9JDP3_RHIR8|nr:MULTISPECIES: acetyl-CoA carboxylase biotin carboxyl carrier protein [Rhizobium]ACM26244.1 acetyl-CoA carboxylase, biotin carboxyl carrier protein [Rhizobium rhizogenes K84]KAA6490948.1 acetyl-CoA carboxylase biotin carboxyl carrier protein [Agrobacterium sp. ICMP 7243]MCJ9724803.1 acetyl-CoA carboxylase biotin carboxyl carrier protein [Agrobacterium sp. BETTINA12B]MCJ9756863.1 acetyl-CoA carboxylase biotin carboxyl carrier protein [Agrobacterium sp. SHOUNA12C]OCJ06402.1 acetyl-CoA carboxyl